MFKDIITSGGAAGIMLIIAAFLINNGTLKLGYDNSKYDLVKVKKVSFLHTLILGLILIMVSLIGALNTDLQRLMTNIKYISIGIALISYIVSIKKQTKLNESGD